jgi:hypothetical protein
MSESITSCQTCKHCDTTEATRVSVRGSVVPHVVVGVCTHPMVFFHGKQVPDWITGCVDFEPIQAEPVVLVAILTELDRILGFR